MFDLKKELQNLPDAPGVYLMHDKDGEIIYVGKAKVLKNRVRQYFQSQKSHTQKVRAMVSHIAWFEYIITDSELEALVLECNLIKKHKPHYNILLKDDKHFPYIKITMNEEYPRLLVTRIMHNDGARYFGPYTGMSTVRNTIEVIKRIFLIPSCHRRFTEDIGKDRPCLNYQIKKCFAPCRGDASQPDFKRIFVDICRFLDGNQSELIAELTAEMQAASDILDFEKAAKLRDKVMGITAIQQRQKIVSDTHANQDIIAFACYDDKAFVEIFFVRGGRVTGRQNMRMDGVGELSDGEIMSGFLTQYYTNATFIPTELIIQHDIHDGDVVGDWLSGKLGRKVTITVPKRGDKVAIIKMVHKNAQQAIGEYKLYQLKKQADANVLGKLADYLGLNAPPRRIEAYDISNIAGTNNVGAMVVFTDALPDGGEYRKFRIKLVEGQDDYSSMCEMIYRRFKHAQKEMQEINAGTLEPNRAKFIMLPDLILLDGGKGHVAAVRQVLEKVGVDIPMFGMVKDNKHKFRGLIGSRTASEGETEIRLPGNSAAYSLVGNISEQVHKEAIAYHIKLRGKKGIASELANIDGIGDTRRKVLIKHFKSLDAIAAASAQELMSAGLDKRSAHNVWEHFNS